MTRIANCAVGGFAFVATLFLSPDYSEIKAWPSLTADRSAAGFHQVNRMMKGDRLAAPHRTPVRRDVVRTVPNDEASQPARLPKQPRELPDGCEPMFSPITMPTMAHIAGRCIG